MKIYCVNKKCPFSSCKIHLQHCRNKKREIWVANYDSVCKKYITCLVKEILGGR